MTSHNKRPTTAALAFGATAVVVLLSACGAASDGDGGSTAVAAPELDGRYTVVGPSVDGDSLGPVTLELDAEFGALVIDAGCGTLLGSFTLAEDGLAGFTVAGGRERPCPDAVADRQERLLTTLAAVRSWRHSGESIELEAPDQMLTLRR